MTWYAYRREGEEAREMVYKKVYFQLKLLQNENLDNKG
jgi:hypothetical protein